MDKSYRLSWYFSSKKNSIDSGNNKDGPVKLCKEVLPQI